MLYAIMRLLVNTLAVFLAVNAYLFYISTLGLPITSGGCGESIPFIVASSPVWLWVVLGGLLLAILLWVLEGLTGLDSPTRFQGPLRQTYWRLLSRLSMGERAPLSPVRRFCQRLIYRKKYRPLINESAAATIRLMLQELGPTFVKLGQIISSRAEQLPPEWRTELAQLQNEVEPFSVKQSKLIICEELCQTPEQLFASFEDVPFAAASTAQVHKVMLPDGQMAVVKVQRPDIDVTVHADLNVMRDVARIMERRFTWAKESDVRGIMMEYADAMSGLRPPALCLCHGAGGAISSKFCASWMAVSLTTRLPTS